MSMNQLKDTSTNALFLARRMDAMADMLTPEDELAAAQAEVVRGVWLAEMLGVLRDRAEHLGMQIESMHSKRTFTKIC